MSEGSALPHRPLAPIAGAMTVVAVLVLAGIPSPAAAEEPAPPAATPAVSESAADTAAAAPASDPGAAAPATAQPGAPAAPGSTPVSTSGTAPLVPVTRPRIVAESLVQDAGKVRKGKKVDFNFTLANQGDAPLKIKDAQPSCGCTVASFDKEVAPGATGKIHARVETENFDGPIAKHITVLSNDPDTPRLVLTVKADVQAFVRVSPTYARLLQVQTQAPETTAVNLWATDGKALEIRSIETPFDWVAATARRPTDAERTPDVTADQWRIEISLTGEAPLGPLRGSIRVTTSHPEEPTIEIPLSGNVRQILHFQPGEADFGKLTRAAKDPKRFVVKLFNFGKDPVDVRSVATDLPFVSASISAEEPGRRFRIELLLAADAPKGKFEGRLKAETSSPLMPALELPVRGKVE